MNDELIASIEDLGLSQKEARVYMANLMLGPATVQKIADQSGIKRVTTYVILESLNNLGLVSQSTKGKKTYFVAEEPTQLNRLLQKKEQAIKEQRKHFEAILPELNELKSLPTESANVRFYDTVEGIRGVVGTFLSSHKNGEAKTVYGISNLDQVDEFFPEIAEANANPDRIRANVNSKFIYTSKRGPIIPENDPKMRREARYIDQDKFNLNGDVSIFGDSIVMVSFSGSKPMAVTIQSQELAKTMLAIFQLAWDGAEAKKSPTKI